MEMDSEPMRYLPFGRDEVRVESARPLTLVFERKADPPSALKLWYWAYAGIVDLHFQEQIVVCDCDCVEQFFAPFQMQASKVTLKRCLLAGEQWKEIFPKATDIEMYNCGETRERVGTSREM